MNSVRLLVLVTMAGSAHQLKVPEHLLDMTDGPFACHAIEATAADSASSLVEFIDGEVNTREAMVAFDSSGVPLYMTVQMSELTPSLEISHNVLVRFNVRGEYLRIEKPLEDGKVVNEVARIALNEALAPDEMTRSKQFAVWLWDHGCSETGKSQ